MTYLYYVACFLVFTLFTSGIYWIGYSLGKFAQQKQAVHQGYGKFHVLSNGEFHFAFEYKPKFDI